MVRMFAILILLASCATISMPALAQETLRHGAAPPQQIEQPHVQPAASAGQDGAEHETAEPADTGHEAAGHGAVEHGDAEHGAAEHGGGDVLLELPDLIHQLKAYFGSPGDREEGLIDYLFTWRGNIFALLILTMIGVLLARGAARKHMIPTRFQNTIEYVVETFYNFVQGILGHHAREFTPFLGTLFLYIWFMNLSGLVPLLKAPTSLFETTLGLAIVVFLYVHITGFRKLGVGGYLYHLIGSPVDAIGWAMVPLMLPLHIIGEIAKPVSLALRLFGNIMGEDVLIAVFTWLGVMTLSFIKSPIGLPLEFPFIFLGLLLSTIQALVFTLLSSIYISQMLPHEEEHGH
jgi:F-type H+-transporting ATPase subunit a